MVRPERDAADPLFLRRKEMGLEYPPTLNFARRDCKCGFMPAKSRCEAGFGIIDLVTRNSAESERIPAKNSVRTLFGFLTLQMTR